MGYEIKDISLAEQGLLRVEWSDKEMPVLARIREEFSKHKPLKGVKIAACLHVTSETANLVRTLKAGGAQIVLCASNPLSTQDDVAASLVSHFEIPVYAIKGEDEKTYYQHIRKALAIEPDITMDDGADLVSTLHSEEKSKAKQVIGGTEETTTGVIRLRSMAEQRVLLYPIIAVNDAQTKYLFDNRYGTGQSTLDGLLRASNVLIAGRNFVVSGYGWCGRGIAMRARGMGASVIVHEVDPLRALEAVMDGYRVLKGEEAAKVADIWITATGDINVIDERHFKLMKDKVLLANAGHFNVEINISALEKLAVEKRRIREFIEEYKLADGRRIFLLTEGRLINLSAAEGHPASVMDMSFANQALSVEYIVKNAAKLDCQVYPVPRQIDEEIARLKLLSMDVAIDELTAEQNRYLKSWEMGT
jgi:adenosylhomocysteinase